MKNVFKFYFLSFEKKLWQVIFFLLCFDLCFPIIFITKNYEPYMR